MRDVCAFFLGDCPLRQHGRDTTLDAVAERAFLTPNDFLVEAAPEDKSRILPQLLEMEVEDACNLSVPSLVSPVETSSNDPCATTVNTV